VVRPAMQEDRHGSIAGTGFGVPDAEHAGIDLLQRGERGMRPRFDVRHTGGFRVRRLCTRDTDHTELCSGKSSRGSTNEAAPIRMDLGLLSRIQVWPPSAAWSGLHAGSDASSTTRILARDAIKAIRTNPRKALGQTLLTASHRLDVRNLAGRV